MILSGKFMIHRQSCNYPYKVDEHVFLICYYMEISAYTNILRNYMCACSRISKEFDSTSIQY